MRPALPLVPKSHEANSTRVFPLGPGNPEFTDLCFVDGGSPSLPGMALGLDCLNGSIRVDLTEHQFITWHFISLVLKINLKESFLWR